MKVLLSSASFSSHYGGPAYSVRALAEHLASRGLSIAIWAPDDSASSGTHGGRTPTGNQWLLRGLGGSLREALSAFGIPDIFHDSGIWLPHNHAISRAARRAGRPVVVSVRGMLEPAALRHRSWKKRIAWHLYQRRDLETAAALHVTSDLEAQNVSALGLRSRVVCIPNGVIAPDQLTARSVTLSKTVVFLGRLHPIKGLPMLLEAWARIRPSEWSLEIAGPDEGGHRKALEKLVDEYGIASSVSFTGPVKGAQKDALLRRASLFVLPSYSENFGVAVGEALAAGIPVIATTGTPWSALQAEACGWYVAASVSGLEEGLRSAIALPQTELIEMGRRGHAFVRRTFSWDRVAEDMEALYQQVLS